MDLPQTWICGGQDTLVDVLDHRPGSDLDQHGWLAIGGALVFQRALTLQRSVEHFATWRLI